MGPYVVLAYSGGLDTSAIVPWLKERYDARVVCYVANVGQGAEDLVGIEGKATHAGAEGCVVDDLKEQFVTDFVFPTLMAGAVYARSYLLGTAMARPIIARGQVETARQVGATALAHGCTGKGNDQVRFELGYQALAPDLGIIAPWREWEFRGREDLMAYVQSKGIALPSSGHREISRDQNLWHCSHEGGPVEDPGTPASDDLFLRTVDPIDAPDHPEDITIEFDRGIPVGIDVTPRGPVALIEALNDVAGAHGVGRADIVEDRLVGMKSRGIYETPGGTVLRVAHRALEQLVLDRRTLDLKDQLAPRYADLVYEGRWWTPEREALDALVNATQRSVTGSVRVRLYRGNVTVISRTSPFSLFDTEYATFAADDVYDQADAAGFIKLYGLPVRIASQARVRNDVLV